MGLGFKSHSKAHKSTLCKGKMSVAQEPPCCENSEDLSKMEIPETHLMRSYDPHQAFDLLFSVPTPVVKTRRLSSGRGKQGIDGQETKKPKAA
jgi:hypothetical protein